MEHISKTIFLLIRNMLVFLKDNNLTESRECDKLSAYLFGKEDMDWIYDIETYPNVFTFSIVREDGKFLNAFEVSFRKNEIDRVLKCLDYINKSNDRMVGFNNLAFDYPVLHYVLTSRKTFEKKQGTEIAKLTYGFAMQQIESMKGDRFAKVVKDEDTYCTQLDLYKIHHFDNKARSTSLKMLEFNMKADNIEDLPFAVGTELTEDEIDILIKYNKHDVMQTYEFYKHSVGAIKFREELSVKYGRNFLNHNDTKIGKDYFIMELEKAIPGSCYRVDEHGRRHLNQSKRVHIDIRDCLFSYYDFQRPEFIAVLEWFKKQRIKETKGVFSDIPEHRLGDVAKYADMQIKRDKFKGKPSDLEVKQFKEQYPLGWVEIEELKSTEYLFDENGNHVTEYKLNEDGSPDLTKKPKKVRVPKKSYWKCWKEASNLNVVVEGFRFDFGTGGIHGSIESKIAKETKKYQIVDADVSSMYPNIAIANRVYPEHLSEKFCDIYEDVYIQRKSFPKGSSENSMLKLALNGVYGDSNNQYSPFYDPKYTMSITINGQLSLCLLAEKFMQIEGLKLIQVNTDGVTVALPRDKREEYDAVCKAWQKQVGLELEFAEYSKMIIRDVNNYIAVYTNGKVKRKGAYQYQDLGWHQNQGGLVIPMAAEAAMLNGVDIREFIQSHLDSGNIYDFMLRTKVPRSSKLVLEFEDGRVEPQQNICRYVPSKQGGKLMKLMPALEGKESEGERRISIDSAWNVKTCNDIKDFDPKEVDLDYYVQEAEKLVIGG